jgi:hypothetical protein
MGEDIGRVIADTARMVGGPDEPFHGHLQNDMEADQWASLAAVLRRHGVHADARSCDGYRTTSNSASSPLAPTAERRRLPCGTNEMVVAAATRAPGLAPRTVGLVGQGESGSASAWTVACAGPAQRGR